MNTFGEIKTEISGLIGRGTSQDGKIFGYVQSAVREVERKRNFNHMYHLMTLTNDPGADLPRTIRIPNREVRSINFLRVTHQEGVALTSFGPLDQIYDARKMYPPAEGMPTQYMLTQGQLLTFNNTPLLEYTFEAGWWEYTNFANDSDAEHWLFDNFKDGLVQYALHFSAMATRDYQRAQTLEATALRKLDDLMVAEEDKELGNAEVVMQQDFYDELMG
jgi:hypothetical protein